MSWGRLKPFWQSAKWKKSAKLGTGVFSWGGSDLAKGLDLYVPGMGTNLDAFLDKFTKSEQDRVAGVTSPNIMPKPATMSAVSLFANNPLLIYGIGALVLYKLFK